MLTRCPACQTVFRLRPEQLRARHGEVRCGHCFNPFNALEHLIETGAQAPDAGGHARLEPSSGMQAAPSKREPQLPPPAAAAPRSSFSDLEFDIPDSVPAAALKVDPDDRPDLAPQPADRVEPELDPWSARMEPSLPPVTEDFAPEPAAPNPPAIGADLPETGPRVDFSAMIAAAGSRLAETGSATPPIHDHDDARLPSPEAPTEPGADFETPAAPAVAAEPSAEAAADADPVSLEPELPPEAAYVDTAHLDAHYGAPPARHPVRSAIAGVLLTVLTLALLLQSAWFFREHLVRSLPGLRPLFVAACDRLGCDMPLPRDAALINIDSPDLQSEPGRPGRYILYATIQNRADYPQAWPHLELTLTDAHDSPLVRRVLAPAEWVAADKLRADFRARSDAMVKLGFDAPDIAPTGYRVYVFYP